MPSLDRAIHKEIEILASRKHFIVSSENLRRAAVSIFARIQEGDGSLSEGDVFTELEKACISTLENREGLLRHPNSLGEEVKQRLVVDQLQDSPKMQNELAEIVLPSQHTKTIDVSIVRMLALAKLWKGDSYQNYKNKTAVFSFMNVGIVEFELVCLADLLEASASGNHPHYVDSAYRLLQEVRSLGKARSRYFCDPPEHQLDDLLYSLSYRVPLPMDIQIGIILDTWIQLKFKPRGNFWDPRLLLMDLLHELDWIEERAR